MKRNRYQVAAGILEIIVGAFLACSITMTAVFGELVGEDVEWFLYILPFFYIFEGILYCLRKGNLAELLIVVLLNIVLIIVELCSHGVLLLGVLGIGLLAVASILMLLSIVEDADYGVVNYFKNRKKPAQTTAKMVQSDPEPSNLPAHDHTDFVAITDPTADGLPADVSNKDVTAKLQILKKLFDTGILTEEEYTQQKMVLLRQILHK